MEFMPLTAGYGCVLPLSDSLHVRTGVLAGATFEKSKGRPGIDNSRRAALTYGVPLHLDIVLGQHVSLGISGKLMHFERIKDLRKHDAALLGINCLVLF